MYKAHKSVATKVCWHEFDAHLLASGSKDASVWLYDVRTPDPLISFV
jgi:WD40 repeat protein